MDALTARLIEQLRGYRFRFAAERDLQDGVERIVRISGWKYERERRLSQEDVIDFLVEGSTGIEVKVDGSFALVARQLHRYAAHPEIEALILVTSKSLHNMPGEINGKPVVVINVNRSAF